MDPISVAVDRFAADIEDFWRAHPERIQPLIAAESERDLVVQGLRKREHAHDNRRPFVVFEAPFVALVPYFVELGNLIAGQYEAVRGGVAEEGLMLPPFGELLVDPSGAAGPVAPAALAAERAAGLLGAALDGLVVALAPAQIVDAAAWREAVSVLLDTPWSPRVRWALLSPPGGPITDLVGSEGAALELDSGDVLAFVSQQKPPAGTAPEATAAPASADEPAETAQALVLEAASAQAEGDARRAARSFAEARAICRAGGLRDREAVVLVALGGALAAAGEAEASADTYREAAQLAQGAEAWAVAADAWMGLGAAYLGREAHGPAAAAFRAGADAAARAEIVPLRIEGLRMAGVCWMRLGRDDEAIGVWNEAVEAGGDAAPGERAASSVTATGEALIRILMKRGLDQQAAHVRRVLTEGDNVAAGPAEAVTA